MGETEVESEPPVPPLLMCTARVGELRIGPTLYDVLTRIELKSDEITGEQLDAALQREGFTNRYAWQKDGAGAWTLVAKTTSDV